LAKKLAEYPEFFKSEAGKQALVITHIIVTKNGGSPEDAEALLQKFIDQAGETPQELEDGSPTPIELMEGDDPKPLASEPGKEPEPVLIDDKEPIINEPKDGWEGSPYSEEEWDEAHELNEDYDKTVGPEKTVMFDAMERYTRISAQHRGDHLGRLEESGSGRGGKFLKFANRVLHPLKHKKSTEMYTERQVARREFQAAVRAYTDKVTDYNQRHGDEYGDHGHNRATLAKINLLDTAEDRVLRHEIQIADDRVYNERSGDYDQRQEGALTRWAHNRAKKFAVNWYNSGKVGKVFKVIVPAAAAGAGIGAISFLTGGVVPGAVFAAAGAYAGKRIGHAEAGAASRRMILDRGRQAQLYGPDGQSARRREALIASADLTASPDNVDITSERSGVEAGTNRRIGENQRRHAINESLAAAVGGVAAGLVDGNGLFNTDIFARNKHHAASAVQHADHAKHAKHAKHAVAQTHSKDSLGANGYPWDVAHQAAEKGYIPQGHEMQTIQQYNAAYNHAHGTHFGLEHFAGQQNGVESVSEAPGVAQNAAEQLHYEEGLAKFILTGKV
jgi:hypothetical protein